VSDGQARLRHQTDLDADKPQFKAPRRHVVANQTVLARLRTPLAIFQMLTLAALALVIFVSVLLLHHETDDYFTSLPSYLSSIKIVVPPAAIFLFTYAFAFVTGTALTDAPKAALSFARNTFFQSVPWMAFTLAASTLFVCSSAWLLTASTPPAYESLVNDLLFELIIQDWHPI
jgi:hypothetical protein